MSQTEKLFRADAYCVGFEGVVLGCEARGDRWIAVLDRTAFYPEGGGQPADRGTLGGASVLDVHEKNGCIEHTLDRPLALGERVRGELDWPLRFSRMQHHTGEHIVSGLVHRLYRLDNVGFHMGEAMVTVDFNGPLSAGQLEQIELLANRAVFANLAVEERYPDAEALAALEYRSKKELVGEVRIVSVPGADVCACCGTHVARTGEIGCIKLLSPQSYKGGIRVGILCGERALLDYRAKDHSVATVAAMLSTKQSETIEAVERLARENEALHRRLSEARAKLFSARCAALGAGDGGICLIEEELAPVELRKFAVLLSERRGGVCAVFSGADGNGYQYALAARTLDLRAFSKE
ncbi:MAG: alanyl-tRNA editing protein, partial [Oscillospiraceae bacterium]